MIHCSHCDAPNANESSFCSRCGAPLQTHSIAEQPSSYDYPPQHGQSQHQPQHQPQYQPQYQPPQGQYYQQPPYQQPPYQQPPQQQPYDINVSVSTQASPNPNYVLVQRSQKSVGLAVFLSFLFGPLGMFYSTVSGALIMLLVSFVIGIITYGLAAPFLWLVCMVWAGVAADNHNKGK